MLLVAMSLVMVLTGVVPVQARPQSPAERLDLVPEGCEVPEHRPGEFWVTYDSDEALQAAPKENVVETSIWGPPGQRLLFEYIKNEPDPDKRRILEEAKKRELEERPGVAGHMDGYTNRPHGKTGVTYVWGPEHSSGEFWVVYESEDAMRAAPDENVVEENDERGGPGGDTFSQRLRFEEIENEPAPERRRAAEEARMRELEERPGVKGVGYAYPFAHQPGEFWVIYDSEEAMRAAPKENVVWEEDRSGPGGGPFMGVQVLRFEEIRDEPDPKKRRALEEAKMRELRELPGVRDATYIPGDAAPDCYWDMGVTPEGGLNFANARHELYGYVCSPGGLEDLFGGDGDAQRRLCGIYQSNPEACATTHRPGEFIVHYRSGEDMRTAPRANVVEEKVSEEPGNEFYAQLLIFDEIRDEPNPDKERTARIAKLRELESRPGVRGVRYAVVTREQHQECADAEFPNPGGPGKPPPGEPKAGEPKAGEPKAGEPKAGEPKAGEPKAGARRLGGSQAGEPQPGLYEYVCVSPEGFRGVFGGDVDLHFWF